MEDMWIRLDSVGITNQPFVVIATIDGEAKNYIYYFEGTA